MNMSSIRSDFPILKQTIHGKPLIYFDNACMSLRPQSVIDAVSHYYTDLSACAGRSNHRLAAKVTQEIDDTRQKVKKFLNASSPAEIIFTRNTTEGLNLVASSLGLKTGDTVVTSDKEHNSNLVPWLKLKRTLGINHQIVVSNADNTFNLNAFSDALTTQPVKLVSLVHTSNLDGVTNPMPEIVKLAHEHGALVMVDAAQSAPHQPLDVQKLDVDFLAFSGHKLCGPSGTGVLYGKKKLLESMDGFLVGGDTVAFTTYTDYQHLPLPEKFEAGLQDYAGIIGLGAAIDYLNEVGFDYLKQQELILNSHLTETLSNLPRLHLLGPEDHTLRSGIYSFYVDGADSHQISLLLDESYGIMVRSGQHCVHSWFNAKGIKSSVRASLYFYNTLEEVDRFAAALKSILTII